MINSEDNAKEMPIERNYEPHVQNREIFLHNGSNIPFDIDDTIEKNEDSKVSNPERDIEYQVGSTGAKDEFTATLDLVTSNIKKYSRSRVFFSSLLAALLVVGILLLTLFLV